MTFECQEKRQSVIFSWRPAILGWAVLVLSWSANALWIPLLGYALNAIALGCFLSTLVTVRLEKSENLYTRQDIR